MSKNFRILSIVPKLRSLYFKIGKFRQSGVPSIFSACSSVRPPSLTPFFCKLSGAIKKDLKCYVLLFFWLTEFLPGRVPHICSWEFRIKSARISFPSFTRKSVCPTQEFDHFPHYTLQIYSPHGLSFSLALSSVGEETSSQSRARGQFSVTQIVFISTFPLLGIVGSWTKGIPNFFYRPSDEGLYVQSLKNTTPVVESGESCLRADERLWK